MKKEEVLIKIEKLDKMMTEATRSMAKSYFKKKRKRLTPKQYALYMWEEYYAPYIDTDPRVLPQNKKLKGEKVVEDDRK